MGTFGGSLLVSIAIVLTIAFFQVRKLQNLEQSLLKEFPDAKIFVSLFCNAYLLIDFASSQLVIGPRKPGTRERAVVPFSGIIKAEVIQDGAQIAKTNRGSQAMGVAVGALALGGVGALLGGLTASSTTLSGTRKLSLRITVDSTSEPVHDIVFYESAAKGGVQSSDGLLRDQSKLLATFAGYLEAAIHRAEEARAPAPVFSLPTQDKSVPDQIADLWKLKEVGALTQAEFDSQKARLIGG